MSNTNPQSHFDQADLLLQAAGEEFNRSEEDAVTHLICHNSRMSIAHLMMGYLLEKGAHLPYPTSLEALLEKCIELDPAFRQLDLTHLDCRFDTDDKDYCLDYEMVSQCYKIAKDVQARIRQIPN